MLEPDRFPAERVITPAPASREEEASSVPWWPQRLAEYVGQARAREQLEIFIQAARQRSEALDHVLLFGPLAWARPPWPTSSPGDGGHMRQTSGPVLERAETWRPCSPTWSPTTSCSSTRSTACLPWWRRSLPGPGGFPAGHHDRRGAGGTFGEADPPFTLVGPPPAPACSPTPAGSFRHRRPAGVLYAEDWLHRRPFRPVDERGCLHGRGLRDRRRSRGTPRIANRLLRRVRDYAEVKAGGRVDEQVADAAPKMLEVDSAGLDVMDRKLLSAMLEICRRPRGPGERGGGHWRGRRIPSGTCWSPISSSRVSWPAHPEAGVAQPLAWRHFGLIQPGGKTNCLNDAHQPGGPTWAGGGTVESDYLLQLRANTLVYLARAGLTGKTPMPVAVYYANYLKFLERARTEWLSELGLEQDRLAREEGVVFVVRRVEAGITSGRPASTTAWRW